MNFNIDGIYNNLRQKLDILGYTQPLPISALSLVGSLYQDLIKTTESLRDATLKISDLLEEKSCWELGTEPYKCDNTRLINECNKLSLELLQQREQLEEKNFDLSSKIRHLQADKRYLEDHSIELENRVRELTARAPDSKILKTKKDGANMSKKPAFVTTVRSGVYIRNPKEISHDQAKCTKCNSVLWRKHIDDGPDIYGPPNQHEIEQMHANLRDAYDQVGLHKKKIEARDREISRLNELLSGGRPSVALSKDCCYKNVGTLSEDLEILQREKSENALKIQEYQEQMHEAKIRAVDLNDRNLRLQSELDELKKTALEVESQANEEIAEKEQKIHELSAEIKNFNKKLENMSSNKYFDEYQNCGMLDDKRKLNKKLNELTVKEQELHAEVDKLQRKNEKLKLKLQQKDSEDRSAKNSGFTEEEKIRLKTERDFFQKEYLSLIGRTGSEKEIEFLQNQVRNKDEELRQIRTELIQMKQTNQHGVGYFKPPHSAISTTSCTSSNSPAAVQAAILRVEREKDCIRTELDRTKLERDTLKQRYQCSTESHFKEIHQLQEKVEELKCKISNLEKDKRGLETQQIPGQTHITLMKHEIEELKKRIFELQSENCKAKANYNQLKILHEQTEKALVDTQNKFTISETHLENAESRLNTLGSNRDVTVNEIGLLKNEIGALKSLNKSVEAEKDKLMNELDNKTEKIYYLENENKTINRKNKDLEKSSLEVQEKFEKLSSERKNRENELHETSFESKTLRQQLTALKESREEAVVENGRLTNELAEHQSNLIGVKSKLKESEKEVNSLRKQLQQYVNEVQKAENILMAKEKEREEMLEHYRCLSHDAVLLEGNNQSLEIEAAEHKRQLCEAEADILALKEELCTKNDTIQKLEKQVSCLSAQCCNLEKELEQSYDDQRLIKVDLEAMKELCDKLDFQRDKLNAELEELGAIRKKLERENERLRRDTERSVSGGRVVSDTIERLLDKTRDDLDDTRRSEIKLSQETSKLKEKCNELEVKLNLEREKVLQKEALAKEYSVQIQELRHNLIDDRFKAAQSREHSPRYPTV